MGLMIGILALILLVVVIAVIVVVAVSASASAAIYSLVETAKANGLNVYAYLQHLLLYMPSAEWQQYPEELDELMPWSPEVQAQCKQ